MFKPFSLLIWQIDGWQQLIHSMGQVCTTGRKAMAEWVDGESLDNWHDGPSSVAKIDDDASLLGGRDKDVAERQSRGGCRDEPADGECLEHDLARLLAVCQRLVEWLCEEHGRVAVCAQKRRQDACPEDLQLVPAAYLVVAEGKGVLVEAVVDVACQDLLCVGGQKGGLPLGHAVAHAAGHHLLRRGLVGESDARGAGTAVEDDGAIDGRGRRESAVGDPRHVALLKGGSQTRCHQGSGF